MGSLVIETDDARGLYEQLKARGVTDFTQEPMDHFYGTDLGIRDPFGNAIRILAGEGRPGGDRLTGPSGRCQPDGPQSSRQPAGHGRDYVDDRPVPERRSEVGLRAVDEDVDVLADDRAAVDEPVAEPGCDASSRSTPRRRSPRRPRSVEPCPGSD